MSGKESYTDPRRLAREDILRYLREHGAASIEEIVGEIGEEQLVRQALRNVEGEGLVSIRGDRVELTVKGESIAERLYERHRLVEDRIGAIVGRPHLLAHSLEHFDLSIEDLAVLARRRLHPLSRVPVGSSARLLAVFDARPTVLSRVYGVGLLPGRRIRVIGRPPGLVVVEVGAEARVAAVDAEVAEKIIVSLS